MSKILENRVSIGQNATVPSNSALTVYFPVKHATVNYIIGNLLQNCVIVCFLP